MAVSVGKYRKRIDSIDAQIVGLLGQRISIVREIAATKAVRGAPIVDADREAEIFRRVARGLDRCLDESVVEVFREIILQSRRQQVNIIERHARDRRMRRSRARVAIAATRGSYAEEAAITLLGTSCRLVECESYGDVFETIESGNADCAVVPVRNKIIGDIAAVADLMRTSGLHVIDTVQLTVRHVLAGTHDSVLKGITAIRTHKEVMDQCGSFARLNPDIAWLTELDTARSMKKVIDDRDPTIAAICSPRAARMYGAKVLATDIADDRKNWTRFSLLGFREVEEE